MKTVPKRPPHRLPLRGVCLLGRPPERAPPSRADLEGERHRARHPQPRRRPRTPQDREIPRRIPAGAATPTAGATRTEMMTGRHIPAGDEVPQAPVHLLQAVVGAVAETAAGTRRLEGTTLEGLRMIRVMTPPMGTPPPKATVSTPSSKY